MKKKPVRKVSRVTKAKRKRPAMAPHGRPADYWDVNALFDNDAKLRENQGRIRDAQQIVSDRLTAVMQRLEWLENRMARLERVER